MKHKHPICEYCLMPILVDQSVYSCDCCDKIWHKGCLDMADKGKRSQEISQDFKFPLPKPTYTGIKKILLRGFKIKK